MFFYRNSVVDSVGGDQDRAVDALLAMSDPDHVPAHHVATHEQPSLVRHHYHSSSTSFPTNRITRIIAHHTSSHTPHSLVHSLPPRTPHRSNKPSWTRSLRASCCSRMNSSMPATRSRSGSNRGRCASSPMRSAPMRPSSTRSRAVAAMLANHRHSVIR